jgi:hypothetical protein
MVKKIITAILILCSAAAFAEDKRTETPRLEIPSAQTSGFGGSHIAFTDNVSALLVNPAAIIRVRERSFFAPSLTLISPQKTIGLLGKMKDGDMGSALESLDNPNNPGKIPFGMAVNGLPVTAAWVADGFGFGVWNRFAANVNVIGTNAEALVLFDLIIPVGFAFKILDTDAHDVDAGIALKLFGRGYGRKIVNIMEVIDDAGLLMDDLGAPVILGAGLDLGFIYRWDTGLSAGITLDDIFNHGGAVGYVGGNGEADKDGYYVPFSWNLGLAYDLKVGNFWKGAPGFLARTGVTFAFDWRNFDLLFETENPYLKRNPALNIGLGLQFTFADVFKLRLGMNEMLPAVGLGFDMGSFEFDISYYGREMGLEPGQMPSAALDLTIAIRPEAKARDWPWTRSSLVTVIGGMVKNYKAKKATAAE